MDERQSDAQRASRIKLLLMFLLPLLAVGLSTLIYYTGIGIPQSTTNRGVLLVPPRQIDELVLRGADSASWHYADQVRDWGLLNVGDGACAAPCRERLYLTRQIRLALGRNSERVNRYYLLLDRKLDPEFARYIAAEHKDLQILYGDIGGVRAWLPGKNDPDPLSDLPIFVIDQRGFAMMYYLPRHTGADSVKDLRFLLEHSREQVH